MQHLSGLIEHYGYFGIIMALIGGIVGLPIPDEVLLTYVGYNVYQGKMLYLPALMSAFFGAFGGITLSYLLGIKLGLPFLKKFGPKFHMTEERVERTRKLFMKFGPYLLIIGYFIPGVRHVVAYLSGINGYKYRRFALFAYSGALIWCFTFITLGRTLGENWMHVGAYLSRYSTYVILPLIVVCLLLFTYWRKTRVFGK
ncbi:DedA family protein [Neobacillus kokaensis]|uniref:Alkaline phosphatase n=1 Tax=Neobacillus kokaensis TaxID=2759023 RepID=A0ABQ3N489_9BACI|nr:DedA family protein [Neobacillus kokaensis]GHH99527.1 alkaline phosphatase [Neobacillus kokaensis]